SDRHEVLRRVREEAPPRPRQVCPGVPPALEAVCLKALARDPGDRYATAEELARDVQRWLADEPPSAYRETRSERTSRWARRHRPLVAGVAALLVTAVVALTAGVILLGQEQQQTEEARQDAVTSAKEAKAKATMA